MYIDCASGLPYGYPRPCTTAQPMFKRAPRGRSPSRGPPRPPSNPPTPSTGKGTGKGTARSRSLGARLPSFGYEAEPEPQDPCETAGQLTALGQLARRRHSRRPVPIAPVVPHLFVRLDPPLPVRAIFTAMQSMARLALDTTGHYVGWKVWLGDLSPSVTDTECRHWLESHLSVPYNAEVIDVNVVHMRTHTGDAYAVITLDTEQAARHRA